MDLTPNRSILQDKTNLISEPTHIKQSGKGLRTPVEKVSEVLSPTKLEKSVSKQTISSDSCSFNSALGSKEVESDTDATATADYDSAGENEFVLAPDSTEQAESLNLTLLANTLDGLHIATPQSDTHSPHDCSLFAVKFTKGEFPSQEELSSETADSSIVDSEQENDASLSGILNLSNASVEEITIAGITPLEFIASVENFENRRLSAARHCAATRSPERAVSNDNNSTVNVIESQLSVENHLNDSSLRENSRSFSGIPNLSNISYEDITGITPFGFIASAENFENNQLSATNVIATDESPNIKTEFEKDLVEDRSQVVEDITDESSTIKTKLDEKDLVEDRSQVIEDITDESSTTKPKLDEKDLVEDRSQVVEDITEESSTIKTKLDDKDLVEDRTQVIEDITDEYSTIKTKFDEKDLVEDKSQVKEDLTGATPIVSAENIQLSAHDNNVIDTSTLKTKLDEKYSIEDKSQLKESEVHSSFENSIPDVNPAPVVLQPPVNSDSVTSQLITDIKTFDLPKHEAVLCISAQESCEQVLSSPKQEFDIKLEAHSQATDINNSLLAACESLAPQETDSCKISPGRLCISDEIAISSSETVNKSADVSECSNLIDKINESSETDGKLTINLDHTIVLPTLVSSAKQESTTLEESLTNVKVRDTVNDVLDFLQTQSSLKTSQVEDSVATVGTQDPNVDTSNQETVGGSSLSDFENSEHPDLKNESPGNVSVTKELTVAITDDLTETVISDLLAKAESGSSSHHQNKVVTSSHRQDLLNGPSEETVSINNNLESECHEVTHTKLECLENISTVHKASPTSTCDQVLTAENNFSGTNSVQSPENVLNVQTSHLDASNNKLDYSSVQTLSEGSLSVEKVDTLNGPALLKEVIDEVCAETLPCVEETAGTLKNEVDEGSFKDKFNEVLPVDSKSPKITLEHEKTISENLKYSEICQETEKEAQNITPVCFKNLLEPLPKADQIKTTLETVNKDLPSVSSELNANIVESENHVDLSLINKPSQESTSLAKQDFVKENSELNASTSSLDESLPLLDAIDESFDIRSENKFENVDQGLKSSEKVNHPEQDKKIVSSKFCIANLNESVSHEPIKESSVILDNTKACFSELIVNCLNQSSLNGPDTVSCLNQASLNGPDTVSCLNQASLNGPDTVSCLNQASLNSPDTVSPTDDLKNNNFPVLRSEDTALKSSVENTSHISSNNTQKVEEAFHRIDVVTENVNKSFSRRLDYASVPQSIEVPAVDELKNKEPVISEKDILDEAFNKLSIEIRDNLLKENSPLKVEASKSPKNKFFVGSDYFTGDETLNLGNSPVAADEKQSFKDNNSEQFELKSACLSEVSKTVPTESSNPNSEDSEKNGNIEELNFDDSLTEQALNLSKEILNTEEDMSDNYTVEMDNRLCSPAKSGGTNLSSLESNGHGNHGVDVDLDKTFEKQSEPTFDIAANSSEAGPITAEEFSIPASAFQFDFDSLPCGARNTRLAGANLTRNSLYVKFDPIVGKILANPENSPVRLLPQTPGRLEESSLERTPMKNPTLDDKLISLTPCSTVDTGDANSSIPEQLDSSIDSVSSKTIENASLNKTDPDITQRVRNLSFEAESKQSSSSATPQANKLQTSRTTARGTVVSQEYYLKELEKLQDLMSKQEQGYQEELKRNTEKMEKLQVEVSTLKKEMHSQAKSLSQSNVVLAEYERTISQLLAQNEADKKQFEVLKEKLIQERDTVTIHLNNTEIAFNDVHQKYERSKTVIEEMKNIQDALKASNQEFEKSLRVQEEKYNKLRSHVAGQLEKANHEMDSMMRSHQAENDKLKAKLKQAEITIKSLENSNEHKSKENKELTQILDELIGKVGADGV